MLFSSSIFLFLFLPLVLLAYHLPLRPWRQGQNAFLLLASLAFYAWGEPWFVLVMAGSILANYGFGLWAAQARGKGRGCRAPVALAAAANLGLLFAFKYLGFALGILNGLGAALPVPEARLPIGISFFTFQALSYVLDVARGRGEAQRSPLKVGLYIAFFPQLIAGPIVKYETVAEQIDHRKETWGDFSAGCVRFLAGLGKKVLIANQLAVVADRAFGLEGGTLPASLAWLGSVCYTMQIYYDFSGYSDMAIGLGRMFGFHFLENFDYPYASRSITEFWRRWHISLSTWFRDYVYFPLGGSRVEAPRHIRNLFAVWLLTGAWHGANWTFIAWGLLYFVLLVLEKYAHVGRKWPAPVQWAYTFLMVNFAWVVFRADSLGAAGRYLLSMLGMGGGGSGRALFYLRENWLALLLAAVFAFPAARRLRERAQAHGSLALDVGYAAAALLVFAIAASYIVKGTYNPFIYFNF